MKQEEIENRFKTLIDGAKREHAENASLREAAKAIAGLFGSTEELDEFFCKRNDDRTVND